MKGLDFGAAPLPAVDASESDEISEADESEDEDEDDEEEEEEESDEEDSEPEIKQAPVKKPSQPTPDVSMKTKKADIVQPIVLQDSNVSSGSVNQPSSSLSFPNLLLQVVPAAPVWTSLAPPISASSQPLEPVATFKLAGLRNKANQLLENLPPISRAGSSSDTAFINQILQNGTHQDKLSALILLVRESPIHAVKELGRLRSMTGWKEDGTMGGGGNKDQRIAVVKALADWWVTGGGKESGKLR